MTIQGTHNTMAMRKIFIDARLTIYWNFLNFLNG